MSNVLSQQYSKHEKLDQSNRHSVVPVTDWSERQVTYLRVSVTDRCNYLCTYCAPAEGWKASAKKELLQFEEIFAVIQIMAWRGVKRVRFTGGEPLLRRDLCTLIAQVNELPEIEEIAMTTNGHILDRYAEDLFQAGVRRLNVSLDSFDPATFEAITRGGDLKRVLKGIEQAQKVGFTDIVLNAVLSPELSQTAQVWQSFCEKAWALGVTPRWIEMMPIGGQQAPDIQVSSVIQALQERWDLQTDTNLNCARIARGPARYYTVNDAVYKGKQVGFISPMSDPHFCASCNRARLTARGGLRACLADDREIDLKSALRMGMRGPALSPFIDQAFQGKRPQHLMNQGAPPLNVMTGLGG